MILSNDQKHCVKLIASHGTHFMQKEGSLQPSQRPVISPVSVPIYSPNLHHVYPMLYHLHLSLRSSLHLLQPPDQNSVSFMTSAHQEPQKLITNLRKNNEPYFLVWTIHYLLKCR